MKEILLRRIGQTVWKSTSCTMETSLASGKIFIVIFLDCYIDDNFLANYNNKQVAWHATITNLYGISAHKVEFLIDMNK